MIIDKNKRNIETKNNILLFSMNFIIFATLKTFEMKTLFNSLLCVTLAFIVLGCDKGVQVSINDKTEYSIETRNSIGSDDNTMVMPYNKIIDSLFELPFFYEAYDYSNRSCSPCDSIDGGFVFLFPSLYFPKDNLIVMATSNELLGLYSLYLDYNYDYQWYYDNYMFFDAYMYSIDGVEIASFLVYPRTNELYVKYVNASVFNNGSKSPSVEGVLCNLAGAYAGHVWIQAALYFAGPIGIWGRIALGVGVSLINYYACSDL